MTTIRLTRRPRPDATAPRATRVERRHAATTDATEPNRLALMDQASARRATLDGAWWPHSSNLSHELPALIEELHHRGVRVTRVAYSPDRWAPAPTRLSTDGRVIRLGWFRTIDPQLLSLTGDLMRTRVDLLVLPPDATEATASQVFAAATAVGNDRSPTALLADVSAACAPSVPPPSPQSSDEAETGSWESEGGRAGV
jgi:hypothetical protein